MMALTVWQPWATLIAIGAKPFEFRMHNRARIYAGQRIAIHSGMRPIRHREVADMIGWLPWPMLTGLDETLAMPLLGGWMTGKAILPLGHVLCTALLGEPIRTEELTQRMGNVFGATLRDSDRFDHTKWGWPLTEIEPLRPPVPARGMQGFWKWRDG